jgi:hypothetical protein
MRMGESDGRADIVSGTFIASLDAVHISGLGSGHAGFGLLVFRPLALPYCVAVVAEESNDDDEGRRQQRRKEEAAANWGDDARRRTNATRRPGAGGAWRRAARASSKAVSGKTSFHYSSRRRRLFDSDALRVTDRSRRVGAPRSLLSIMANVAHPITESTRSGASIVSCTRVYFR